MKFAEIKKHNKNIKAITEILNQSGYSYTKAELGYIGSISAIFNPNKNVVKGYNTIVDIYNKIVEDITIDEQEICLNTDKITAYKKRAEDLRKQQEKLETILQNVEKPENYSRCLKLRDEKEKCLIDMRAEKEVVVKETKKRTKFTYPIIGGIPHPVSHIEEYEEEKIDYVPDEEKRQAAEKRLAEIDAMIKNEPNYEKCLKIERLHFDLDLLKTLPQSLEDLVTNKIAERISEYKELFVYNSKTVDMLKAVLIQERDLILHNVDHPENLKLTQMAVAETAELGEIPANMVTYHIEEDGLDDCRLSNWQHKVNEYIDFFGIKNVEKNDMSKTPKDYIERYNDDSYYMAEHLDDFIK